MSILVADLGSQYDLVLAGCEFPFNLSKCCLYRLENRLSCSARSGAARMIAGALVSVGPNA